MKSLIIGMTVLLFLVVLAGQQITITINEYRIEKFDSVLYEHLEEARFKGYFSENIITSLTNDLLTVFPYLSVSDLTIVVTTVPRYRDVFDVYDERERILYDISVPFDKFIFAPSFFGVTDDGFTYGKSGFVHSEVIRP